MFRVQYFDHVDDWDGSLVWVDDEAYDTFEEAWAAIEESTEKANVGSRKRYDFALVKYNAELEEYKRTEEILKSIGRADLLAGVVRPRPPWLTTYDNSNTRIIWEDQCS